PRGPRPQRVRRRRRGRAADRARDGRRPGPPRGGGRPREGAAVRVIGAGGAVCAGAQRVCASAQFASGNRLSRAAPVPGTPLVPRGAPPPPPSPPAVIELQGISKYYSQGLQKTWVLRHVDLVVEKGEFVTVVGPSGSGKSTLLHLLGLLDEPSGGAYFFEGVPVHTLNERRRTALHREKIGFVFQAYHLLDDLTVYENLETPLLYQKVPAAERKARVAEMLDRFGIVAKAGLFPSQLSGGQQQLVGVARAHIIQHALILRHAPAHNPHARQRGGEGGALRAENARGREAELQVAH